MTDTKRFKIVSGSWAISEENDVYLCDQADHWNYVPTESKMKALSVGDDGYVLSLSECGEPFEWTGSQFRKMNTPHQFKYITVGDKSKIWALERDGTCYKYDRGWNRVSGKFETISCGGDGTCCAVDREGVVYRFDLEKNVWRMFETDLLVASISVTSADLIEAVGIDRSIYRWNSKLERFEHTQRQSSSRRCHTLKFVKEEYRIMTFNLRFDFDGDGPNRWRFRSKAVCDKIVGYNCDILCLQEALQYQYDDIIKALNANGKKYGAITRGREEKSKFKAHEPNEHCSLIFNAEKFRPVSSGFFWLSETPDIPGSKGWDADCVRIASWGLFDANHYIGGLTPLLVVNTHWDHKSKIARVESARLIKRKIMEIAKKSPIPLSTVIFTGDLNCFENTEEFQEMLKKETDEDTGFTLQFKNTRKPDEKLGTFTGWFDECDIVIDYVLVCDCQTSEPKIRYEVIEDYLPEEEKKRNRTPKTPKTPKTPNTPLHYTLNGLLSPYDNYMLKPVTDTGLDCGPCTCSLQVPPSPSERRPRPDKEYHPFTGLKRTGLHPCSSYTTFEDLDAGSDDEESDDESPSTSFLTRGDVPNPNSISLRKLSDHRPVLVTMKF